MAKAPNYTEAEVTTITNMYTSVINESEQCRDEMVDLIAEELGRKRRSIVAKLSNLKIYKAKAVASKSAGIRKEVAAEALRNVAGLPLVSAENLTKVDLIALTRLVTELRDGQSDEDSDQA